MRYSFLSLTRTARLSFVFFFNDTATTEIYTLSLHDALPISASDGWVNPIYIETLRPFALTESIPDGIAQSRENPSRRRRSEEHTSELQSPDHLVCRLLLEKKKTQQSYRHMIVLTIRRQQV